MTVDGESRDEPHIFHCFADYGVESEILSWYGDVVRIGINVQDTNESEPIQADAHVLDEDKEYDVPFADDVTFDLGVFHPVCSKWAATTSISGNPDEHTNMDSERPVYRSAVLRPLRHRKRPSSAAPRSGRLGRTDVRHPDQVRESIRNELRRATTPTVPPLLE